MWCDETYEDSCKYMKIPLDKETNKVKDEHYYIYEDESNKKILTNTESGEIYLSGVFYIPKSIY